jgi:hypothetical protein
LLVSVALVALVVLEAGQWPSVTAVGPVQTGAARTFEDASQPTTSSVSSRSTSDAVSEEAVLDPAAAAPFVVEPDDAVSGGTHPVERPVMRGPPLELG